MLYSRAFSDFCEIRESKRKGYHHAIVSTLEGLELSLNELRGQGYDGAATMSEEKSDVRKQIRDRRPKAVYIHCTGHSLNLVVVSSCFVPLV